MDGTASTSREDEEDVAWIARGKKKNKKGPKKAGAKQQDGQRRGYVVLPY